MERGVEFRDGYLCRWDCLEYAIRPWQAMYEITSESLSQLSRLAVRTEIRYTRSCHVLNDYLGV